MNKVIRFVTVAALIGIAGIGGYLYGSNVANCQAIVLSDITKHQQFTSAISQQVNPDFLTAMTGGAK